MDSSKTRSPCNDPGWAEDSQKLRSFEKRLFIQRSFRYNKRTNQQIPTYIE